MSLANEIEDGQLSQQVMREVLEALGYTDFEEAIGPAFRRLYVKTSMGDEKNRQDVSGYFYSTDVAEDHVPSDHGMRTERQGTGPAKVIIWKLGGAYPKFYKGKSQSTARAIMAALYRLKLDIDGYG